MYYLAVVFAGFFDSLKNAFTWKALVAMLGFAGLGMVAAMLYKLCIFLIPRDCPYCDVPDFVRVTKLSQSDQEVLDDSAEKLGIAEDLKSGYVCRSCKRVADPAVLVGEDPNSYWTMDQDIIYPPMVCRYCEENYVISGGPQEHRTCQSCGSEYSWWKDKSGYLFCISRDQDDDAGDQSDNRSTS